MRTFPIFINVERKPPLVTGGGELAAVKARLLLKRAEIVDIAAGELGPELAELERAGRVALMPCAPRRSIRSAAGLWSSPPPATTMRMRALRRWRARSAFPSMCLTGLRCAASSCLPSSIAAR